MTNKQGKNSPTKIREINVTGKYLIIVAIIGAIATVLAAIIPLLLKSDPDSASVTPALLTPLSTDSSSNSTLFSVTVKENDTEYLFDGELFITVESVARNQHTTGIIGSRGYPNQRFEEVKPGDIIMYEGNQKYEIRIARFGTTGFGVSSSTVDFFVMPVEN